MSTRVSRIVRPNTAVVLVHPNDTVISAVENMIESNVGSIVVLDSDKKLVGIFTERDLLRRVVGQARDPKTTAISDVMSDRVFVVDQSATRQEVRTLMEKEHIRHVPVVSGDTVIGVISLRDVLRSDNADKEFEIDQLRGYVSEKPYPHYPA